ncbi:MAG: hypothetical protein IJP68_10505 [Selenomonadaceae bacterium]|nr:hypothetical protein [Selenomonadaceae bacterium]
MPKKKFLPPPNFLSPFQTKVDSQNPVELAARLADLVIQFNLFVEPTFFHRRKKVGKESRLAGASPLQLPVETRR